MIDGLHPLPRLSIVLPVLNEADNIVAALERLAGLRACGVEVIVVDGGSEDETVRLAHPYADLLAQGPRGRASQMNLGAALARAEVLLFLHADTILPENADCLVIAALNQGHEWGRFNVRIAGASRLFPVIAALMNLRSCITGIATGDQAIFVQRAVFLSGGGFPEIALMEDIAFSRRMRRRSAPACLAEKVVTSGRRWEKHGVVRTVLKMWWLRLRYFFGVAPEKLAKAYGYVPQRR